MSDNSPKIHEIDASGKVLGRLATEIAILLRGKHRPDFDFHIDKGDSVVVLNVEQMKLTGNKLDKKVYFHHSGYPGGLKTKKLSELMTSSPAQVLHRAVYNMLPKNKLRQHMIKRLIFK